MADSLSPQVPPAPGRMYGADQRRQWRATEQLQRQRVTMPATPAAAATGGPIGIVNIESNSGTVASTADGSALDWASVTYKAPEVIAGTGGWIETAGHLVTVTEAGWYQPAMLMVLQWPTASAPEAAEVYTGGGASANHQDSDSVPTVRNSDGTKLQVWRWFPKIPDYMNAGDSFHAEAVLRPFATAPSSFGKVFWSIVRMS